MLAEQLETMTDENVIGTGISGRRDDNQYITSSGDGFFDYGIFLLPDLTQILTERQVSIKVDAKKLKDSTPAPLYICKGILFSYIVTF